MTEAVKIAMVYNICNYGGVLNILVRLLVTIHPIMAPVSMDKLKKSILEVVASPSDKGKYSVLMSGGGQ